MAEVNQGGGPGGSAGRAAAGPRASPWAARELGDWGFPCGTLFYIPAGEGGVGLVSSSGGPPLLANGEPLFPEGAALPRGGVWVQLVDGPRAGPRDIAFLLTSAALDHCHEAVSLLARHGQRVKDLTPGGPGGGAAALQRLTSSADPNAAGFNRAADLAEKLKPGGELKKAVDLVLEELGEAPPPVFRLVNADSQKRARRAPSGGVPG